MTGAPALASGVRRRIDWRRADELLAEGKRPAEVAKTLGCATSTIRRRLARDRRAGDAGARSATVSAKTARDVEELRLQRLRSTLHKAIEEEVTGGNVRVILWLADRLKLIRPPAEPGPEDEFDLLLEGLSPEELAEFDKLKDPA